MWNKYEKLITFSLDLFSFQSLGFREVVTSIITLISLICVAALVHSLVITIFRYIRKRGSRSLFACHHWKYSTTVEVVDLWTQQNEYNLENKQDIPKIPSDKCSGMICWYATVHFYWIDPVKDVLYIKPKCRTLSSTVALLSIGGKWYLGVLSSPIIHDPVGIFNVASVETSCRQRSCGFWYSKVVTQFWIIYQQHS